MRSAFVNLGPSAKDQSSSIKDPSTTFMNSGSSVETSGRGTRALGLASVDLSVGARASGLASMYSNPGLGAEEMILTVGDSRINVGISMHKSRISGSSVDIWPYFRKFLSIFQRENHFLKFKYRLFIDLENNFR